MAERLTACSSVGEVRSVTAPVEAEDTSFAYLVTMLQVEAMPIWFLRKSSSVNPTARSMARLAARSWESEIMLE